MEEEIIKPTKQEMENLIGDNGLIRYYKKIKAILQKYMDMPQEHYSLIALWVMGTYLHKQFSTYPYLFFNAMKGCGKTRILRMIGSLAKNGYLVGSITEAVLFRDTQDKTLCIDEVEHLASDEKKNLRNLLNAGYKKGLKVPRMVKVKDKWESESFDIYCPVAMANIYGMENVLGDRAITFVLEKSNKREITRKIERFENEDEMKMVRGGLFELTKNMLKDADLFGSISDEWNLHVEHKEEEESKHNDLFLKIDKTDIESRNLELFLPLFILADICGEDVLDEVIEFSISLVSKRKQQDMEDNTDIQILNFVSKCPNSEFIAVEEIVKSLRNDLEYDDGQEKWFNSRFVGRALRRLNLVTASRNTNKRYVRLDIDKAKEKMVVFRTDEENKEIEMQEMTKSSI